MKILLIYPPSLNAVKEMMVQTEGEGIGHKPPLGIMYIASYLQKYTEHDITLLDAQVQKMDTKQVLEYIKKINPDIIGITCWSDYWYDIHVLIRLIKDYNSDIHVCLGGPHISIYPELVLEYSLADSVILGDGEVPFYYLVENISNNNKPNNIPGLHFKEYGVKNGSDKFYIQKELDVLPFPARTLLPYKKYTSVLSKNYFITTMITSRGCPHKCTFCKLYFQKTVSRSAKNVVDEMEEISNLGIREIEIYDDTFIWSKKRVAEICNQIIQRRLDLIWSVRSRVDNVNKEILSLMKKAGCRRIHLGIESGLDSTLKRIKKGITTQQAKDAVKMAKDSGLEVLTYFMLGLPGERKEDMLKTVDFALDLDSNFSEFSITIPYAGTEMYEQALKEGLIPFDFWREYSINPTPNFEIPYLIEEFLSKKELIMMRDYAIRKFYFRPKYIAKQFINISSLSELVRKTKMGLQLFKNSISRRNRLV